MEDSSVQHHIRGINVYDFSYYMILMEIHHSSLNLQLIFKGPFLHVPILLLHPFRNAPSLTCFYL